MTVCFTQGKLHREHRCFVKVSYVHIRGEHLIVRTRDADLNFKLDTIEDINIYNN